MTAELGKMLNVDAQTRRRLAELRWLFEKGAQESEYTNPQNGIVAISLLFTAAEQLIALLCDICGTAKSAAEQEAKWRDKVNTFNQKSQQSTTLSVTQLGAVAKQRNNALHSGAKIHPGDLRASRFAVGDFLEKGVTDFFGVDLWSLSVADLVQDDWVRDRLLEAEGSLAAGDHFGSVVDSAAAINICLNTATRSVKSKFAAEYWETVHSQEETMKKRGFPLGSKDEPLRAHVTMIDQQLSEMQRMAQRTLLMQLMEPVRVQRFFSMNLGIYGPLWMAKSPPVPDDPEPLAMKVEIPLGFSPDDASFLAAFAVDLAVELEAMGVDLTKRAKWTPPDPKDMVQPSPAKYLPLPASWVKKSAL